MNGTFPTQTNRVRRVGEKEKEKRKRGKGNV